MKRIRVVATPDPDVAPRAFRLLADSDASDETRLLEWNLGGEIGPTMLFSVDGADADIDRVLLEGDAVHRAELTPMDDGRAVLLLTLVPENVPMVGRLFEAFTRSGLVVETPVVYREGSVRATFVGESRALQSLLDSFPPEVAVDVQQVGTFGGSGTAAALSDRQRQAVEVGIELGYYDVPRGATHEDVADRLGCAPSTASEHLQKAEAKLVRAAIEREEKAADRTTRST